MKAEKYVLAWYDPESDVLVGEKEFKTTRLNIKKTFGRLDRDDPAIMCYDVLATQRKALMRLTGVDIDLNAYCYSVEGTKDD